MRAPGSNQSPRRRPDQVGRAALALHNEKELGTAARGDNDKPPGCFYMQ